MRQDRNAFKLGLTLIVSAVLLCAAVIFIGGKSFDRRDPILVRIGHDQNVARIKAGAPVICGPQQVGAVTAVELIEAPALDDAEIRDFLFFQVRAEVNHALALRSDCVIVAEGSLLGDTGQLRILNRGTASDRLGPEQPVYARASGFTNDWEMITREFNDQNPDSLLAQIKTQLDPRLSGSLIAKIHNSLGDINAITTNIKRTVDPTAEAALVSKLGNILDNLNALTRALRAQVDPASDRNILAKVHQGLDHIDTGLQDLVATITENRPDIRQAVESATHVAVTVDQSILPVVQAEFDRSRAKSLLSQVHNAFDHIDTALADAVVVTDKARRIATLGEDRVLSVIENINQASQHLKAVSKDLRQAPWRLIHKPDATETRESNILDAVREFAEASAHLDESAKNLDALLEANHGQLAPDDPTLNNIRQKLAETLKRFTAAEEALWNRLDIR